MTFKTPTREVAAPAPEDTLQVYARADGSPAPPQLMNPLPEWTVKFFTKVGQRSLGVKLAAPVAAYRFGEPDKLDPDKLLGDLGLLPYELIEFRSEAA